MKYEKSAFNKLGKFGTEGGEGEEFRGADYSSASGSNSPFPREPIKWAERTLQDSTRPSSPSLRQVAKVKDIEELKPHFVEVNGVTVGIYLFKGRYFAFRNTCPHQGGPSVEGETVGNSEWEIMPNGRRRVYTNIDKANIVCPWHGIEFDLESGVCRADPRMRLRKYDIVLEGDYVMLKV